MMTDADILLDIDQKDVDAKEIAERLRFITMFTSFEFVRLVVYETRKGFHLYFWTSKPKPSAKDKVMIQLALGSDYRREIFNYLRICMTPLPKKWNVLFQSKYDKEGNKVSEEVHSGRTLKLEEEIMALYETKEVVV
ncbi:hypothetical protein KAX02_06350 [candidate division WOR-3 bacterium]|nr:hypothetical protein [candidate division WOR-3 bacterium]